MQIPYLLFSACMGVCNKRISPKNPRGPPFQPEVSALYAERRSDPDRRCL